MRFSVPGLGGSRRRLFDETFCSGRCGFLTRFCAFDRGVSADDVETEKSVFTKKAWRGEGGGRSGSDDTDAKVEFFVIMSGGAESDDGKGNVIVDEKDDVESVTDGIDMLARPWLPRPELPLCISMVRAGGWKRIVDGLLVRVVNVNAFCRSLVDTLADTLEDVTEEVVKGGTTDKTVGDA